LAVASTLLLWFPAKPVISLQLTFSVTLMIGKSWQYFYGQDCLIIRNSGGNIMRGIAAIIALSSIAFAAPAFAADEGCAINFQTEDDMKAIIMREGFDFEGYQDLC
jgi:hypothetical protein